MIFFDNLFLYWNLFFFSCKIVNYYNVFCMAGEAEEHLSLLERILPDWISKKAASNGQHFYWQVISNQVIRIIFSCKNFL